MFQPILTVSKEGSIVTLTLIPLYLRCCIFWPGFYNLCICFPTVWIYLVVLLFGGFCFVCFVLVFILLDVLRPSWICGLLFNYFKYLFSLFSPSDIPIPRILYLLISSHSSWMFSFIHVFISLNSSLGCFYWPTFQLTDSFSSHVKAVA